MATSSLHALSINSASGSKQNSKPSPHSSPLMTRKNPTTSLVAVQNDLYATPSHIHIPTAPPSTYVSLNGLGNNSSSSPISNKTTNRMSAPVPTTSSSSQQQQLPLNKNLSKAMSAELSQNNLLDHQLLPAVPPLPPRKFTNRQQPQQSTIVNTVNLLKTREISKSSENILTDNANSSINHPPIESHLPQISAPALRATANNTVELVPEAEPPRVQDGDADYDDSTVIIVGPAETITGIIDTRPLDERNNKPITMFGGSTNLPSANTSNSNSQHDIMFETSSLFYERLSNLKQYNSGTNGTENGATTSDPSNPISYENINYEYVTRLMSKGYSKENAIQALGISRNNFDIACDILHEFFSKN